VNTEKAFAHALAWFLGTALIVFVLHGPEFVMPAATTAAILGGMFSNAQH